MVDLIGGQTVNIALNTDTVTVAAGTGQTPVTYNGILKFISIQAPVGASNPFTFYILDGNDEQVFKREATTRYVEVLDFPMSGSAKYKIEGDDGEYSVESRIPET